MKKLVNKEISSKILMVGEYFKNNAPGGMAAVLASYDMYFEDMKFIPTWKYGTLMIKIWYTIYSYILFLLYMLFDRNIKIVHIQGAAFASFERNTFFVRVGKFFGKKIIMHMHCADFDGYFQPSRHKRRILETINSCDKYFVLSDSWKEYFIGIGVNSNIIVVLNNTVAPPTIRTVNRNNTKIKLLYLGVIGERKGVYDLLEAIWADVEDALTCQGYEDYKSRYLTLYDFVKKERNAEKVSILDDIDFAIEVIQTDKINVTYIMNLLRNVDTANKKQQAKDLEHIKQELDRTDNPELRRKVDLIRAFIDRVMPTIKQNDSIDEAFANFESEQRNKEIEDFANKQEINAEFLKQTISDYEFSNTINKKDIITGIDRPIKFKEKHELVAKIIQFIKENVFKYQ